MTANCAFTETLGYLLMQVAKAHHHKAGELLAPLGLYNGQEILLIWINQEIGQSQSALAEKLCIQPATLTKSLDRMERAGLSQRLADPVDRRVTRVHLTERGMAMCPDVEMVWSNLDSEFFGGLTAAEQDIFRNLLEKIQAGNG